MNKTSALILGICLLAGSAVLGFLLGNAPVKFRQFERTVTVKGLSERDYNADIVIWPIQFTTTSNNLDELYNAVETNSKKIKEFLLQNGIEEKEISSSTPFIVDRSAQQYGDETKSEFRYIGNQTVTVYSSNIAAARQTMGKLSELGKQGIVLTGDAYQSETEYIFTKLNDIKPAMIEEATRNAREVAEKFASDSKSSLGKIKDASQGQFTIENRDKNNPHIKKVRVVSTVTYYLSD
jgi:hypothetical protein